MCRAPFLTLNDIDRFFLTYSWPDFADLWLPCRRVSRMIGPSGKVNVWEVVWIRLIGMLCMLRYCTCWVQVQFVTVLHWEFESARLNCEQHVLIDSALFHVLSTLEPSDILRAMNSYAVICRGPFLTLNDIDRFFLTDSWLDFADLWLPCQRVSRMIGPSGKVNVWEVVWIRLIGMQCMLRYCTCWVQVQFVIVLHWEFESARLNCEEHVW